MSQREIRKEKLYESILETDNERGEILLAREDGMRMLITKDGTMVRHFPDNTRITTSVQQEYVFVEQTQLEDQSESENSLVRNLQVMNLTSCLNMELLFPTFV